MGWNLWQGISKKAIIGMGNKNFGTKTLTWNTGQGFQATLVLVPHTTCFRCLGTSRAHRGDVFQGDLSLTPLHIWILEPLYVPSFKSKLSWRLVRIASSPLLVLAAALCLSHSWAGVNASFLFLTHPTGLFKSFYLKNISNLWKAAGIRMVHRTLRALVTPIVKYFSPSLSIYMDTQYFWTIGE